MGKSLGVIFTEGEKFSDLTDEQKGMVIGGLAFVGIFLVLFIIFVQCFVNNDTLHLTSLAKKAWITAGMLIFLYILLLIIPSLIVYLLVASRFMKRSAKSWVKLFLSVFLGISAYILFIELVLALLNVLLANVPLEIQPIIVIPSILMCGVIMTRISLMKKVQRALGKA
jgi:uncharacterized membrane protein